MDAEACADPRCADRSAKQQQRVQNVSKETRKLASRLRRTEWVLVQQQMFARAERKILEDLIRVKEEDLEDHRQRLAASQRQAMRLMEELRECRSELLQRRRQHDRVIAYNIRLQADHCEMDFARQQCYLEKHKPPFAVKFEDTAL